MMGHKRKRNPKQQDEEDSNHNESENINYLSSDAESGKSEDVTIVNTDNSISFIGSDDDDDEDERPTKRRRTTGNASDSETENNGTQHSASHPGDTRERQHPSNEDESSAATSDTDTYTVVYMRNLPDISTENSVKLFSTTKFGEVEDAVILPKKRQAFVKFKTSKAAQRAVDESGQHAMQNHRIYTSPSHRQTLDKPKVSRRLYVHFPRSQGSLIPKELIQQCFARYGALENVVLRLHRSAAIIVFEREADAAQAKAMLDGQAIFNGCIMQVLYYKGSGDEDGGVEEDANERQHQRRQPSSSSQQHHRHPNHHPNHHHHHHERHQQRRSSSSSHHSRSMLPQPPAAPIPMQSPVAAAPAPPGAAHPGTAGSQPMMMPVYMPSPQPAPPGMTPMAPMPMTGMEEMPPPGCTVPNTVLYVYNLNSQEINAEYIYNLFRGYGIVLRVKLCEQKTMEEKRQEQKRQAEGISKEEEEEDDSKNGDNNSDSSGRPQRYNAAFIQFLRMEQAASAMHFLNQLKLFGRDMVIRWSKKGRILAKPANTWTDKTFPRTSGGPSSGPPSPGLHVSNIPINWTEENLKTRFNKYGQVLRLKLLDNIREVNDIKVRTALLTMDTLENAVDALAQEHRQPVSENDTSLSLNVAFSKKHV